MQLSKGQKVNLTKATGTTGLTTGFFGAGWDAPDGDKVDLDLSVIALDSNGKCRSEDDFVFYGSDARSPNNTASNKAGTIVSTGDNRTGEGDGDDEQMKINFAALDPAITKLVAVLTRYDNGETELGSVNNAFIRAVNDAGSTELAKYDVPNVPGTKSIVFAEATREADGWHLKALGETSTEGLSGLMRRFGIDA